MIEIAALLIGSVALLVGVTNLAVIAHRQREERRNPPGTTVWDRLVKDKGDPDDIDTVLTPFVWPQEDDTTPTEEGDK